MSSYESLHVLRQRKGNASIPSCVIRGLLLDAHTPIPRALLALCPEPLDQLLQEVGGVAEETDELGELVALNKAPALTVLDLAPQLAQGAAGDLAEADIVPQGVAAVSFGDVGLDRGRRSQHLVRESIVAAFEANCDVVHVSGQVVRCLPSYEVPVAVELSIGLGGVSLVPSILCHLSPSHEFPRVPTSSYELLRVPTNDPHSRSLPWRALDRQRRPQRRGSLLHSR